MILMAFLRAFFTALFVIAIPLFLVTTNVRWAFNDLRLFSYGFDKYDISIVTGIERGELMRAARQIRAYFNNSEEFLDVRVKLRGQEIRLYGDRDDRQIQHMRDVKGLVQGVYRLQEGSGAYILAYVVIGLFMARRAFMRRLVRHSLWGGVLTVSLVVLLGLGFLVGFQQLFLAFHLVSFSNTLWQLDPRKDYLIMMFPQGFFFDATMFIALTTVAEAVILAGTAGIVLRWEKMVRALKAVTTTSN